MLKQIDTKRRHSGLDPESDRRECAPQATEPWAQTPLGYRAIMQSADNPYADARNSGNKHGSPGAFNSI